MYLPFNMMCGLYVPVLPGWLAVDSTLILGFKAHGTVLFPVI
jgi:hypothetical protein